MPRSIAGLVQGYAQQNVDLVRHCLTLYQLDILLTAQIPKDLPDASPYPSVQHLVTVLREDYDVILAVPFHVGLALLILQGGRPAPRGLPHGGSSRVHDSDGRACRNLTAKGCGFVFESDDHRLDKRPENIKLNSYVASYELV
jgi:hypothetical protein